jgi:hypothetical protein
VSLENAGKHIYLIFLGPFGGGNFTPRFSFIQFDLDIFLRDREAGRTTVNHDTDTFAVTFSEAGNHESFPQIIAHQFPPFLPDF